MGRGSYTASDWAKLRSSRGLDSSRSAEDLFSRQRAERTYNPHTISLRESRDPALGWESTPIIIGFDVTASMGYLAKELATNSIHRTVTTLLSERTVSHPQLLCSAIGDCKSDSTPLQVTQFESDIRIVHQLLDLYLEGGGGGNNGESYNLLWYFAAYHTRHDHGEKRSKKGYLFTVGDDRCHSGLTASEICRVFPSSSVYGLSNEELLQEVRKKYHVFHIHIEKGAASDAAIFGQWLQLLPGSCAQLSMRDISCLSELITSVIAITEGASSNEVLRAMDQKTAERLARPLSTIRRSETKHAITF